MFVMFDPSDKIWYVQYNAPSIAERLEAGPYTLDECREHKADIESYEGITNVTMETKSLKDEK